MEGYRIPLGALVYYKPPKHRELPAFDPRTLPGIFCGWRLDPSYKFRGVHYILDYESLRENRKGCGRPIQVYTTELVMPEVFAFPLEQRSISRLALFLMSQGYQKLNPEKHYHSMRKYQKFQNVNVELMSLSKGSSDSAKPY